MKPIIPPAPIRTIVHDGPAASQQQTWYTRDQDAYSDKGSDGLDRGIYEPVPGLLDTLSVPKVVRARGVAIEKSLHHPRFALGAARVDGLVGSLAHADFRMRTQVPHHQLDA
jgi:hypothetical protein